MSQSAARKARRAGLPDAGLGGELLADTIETSRRDMRGWRGTEPAKVLNIEQVQIAGGGHQVLLTLDTPEGPRAFVLEPEQAGPAGRRLAELAGNATRGLFVPS